MRSHVSGSARDGGRSAGDAPLLGVIARQRRELEDLRSRAAADKLVDIAVGALAERLRCSIAEASQQLAQLAGVAGLTPAEFATAVLEQGEPTLPRPTGDADRHRRRRAWLTQAALSYPSDGSQIAAAVLTEALAPHGAVAVVLWQLEPDGALTMVGAAGLRPVDVSRWQRVPPPLDCAATRVIRDGSPCWWPGGTTVARVGPWNGARVALPLHRPGGVAGVVEICWPAPLADIGPGPRRELTGLADLCAMSLRTLADTEPEPAGAGADGLADRAGWLLALLDAIPAPVLLAHAMRGDDGAVLDFQVDHVNASFTDPAGRAREALPGRRLLELYPLMGANGGTFERALAVLRSGEPYHADGVLLHTLVGDTVVTDEVDVRVARLFDGIMISWRSADGPHGSDRLFSHLQRLGGFGGWQQDLRTGTVRWTDHTYDLFHRPRTDPPILLEELDQHVHPDDATAVENLRDGLLRLGEPVAASFRIVHDDGTMRRLRVFAEPVVDAQGALAAARGVYQDITSHYRTQLALDVTQGQLADSEAWADDQHRLAVTLQRAVLPETDEAAQASGLTIAVRYRPAVQEHLVGGDWYDTVLLPSGDVLLAVGDVAGHSIRTVAGMTTLRNGLRGLAVTGAGPGQLLRWLNQVAYHLAGDITATAVCCLYRPADHTLRWARAGHLPPVLVRGTDAQSLPLPDGLLLGVDPEATYEEMTTELHPDDMLLLFTDGLIERRGTAIDDALDNLLTIAARPAADVHQRADDILTHATPDTDDDTCLIVVQLQPGDRFRPR